MTFTQDNLVRARRVPEWVHYLDGRQPGETTHTDDDFFITDSSSDYTEVTASGSATWKYGGRDRLSVAFDSQSNQDWAAALKAIPGAGVPITMETRIDLGALEANNFAVCGIGFTSGTAVGSELVAGVAGKTTAGIILGKTSADGDTINSADFDTINAVVGSPLMMRLVWESANTFSVNISTDGDTWVDLGGPDLTRTFTPTHMGFVVTSYGNNDPMAVSYDYLRVNESDLSV